MPSESKEILTERDGVTLQKTESSVLTGNLVVGFDNKNRPGNLILLRPVPNVIPVSISEGNHDNERRTYNTSHSIHLGKVKI